MKWHTCHSCESEFRVISESMDKIEFCPFCGSDIYDPESDEDEFDEEEYDEY
jgi:rRNA maturation endonuclease Nob1